MKLLILLSIIAYGYGDKLDRTYLPPSSAGTAGGSPGALTAPRLSSFGVTSSLGQQTFGQPSGKNTFTQQSSQLSEPFGQQGPGLSSVDRNTPSFGSSLSVGQPSSVYLPVGGRTSETKNAFNSGFGSSAPLGSNVNQPLSFGGSNIPSSGFSQEPSRNTFTSNAPASQQVSTFNQANEQNSSGFSSKSNQPERPQAAADRNAEILRYVNENDGDRFTYSFETSNGISAEEAGVASGGVKAQGGYSYTGDDGKSYTVTYTADEQGFLPQGEHLPTPHPIPEEILKSIEKNAQAAAAGTQEGAYRPEEYESEDNVQQYNSGDISSNRPQEQVQASNQQYTPSKTPTSESLGFQQAGSENVARNIPASQSSFTNTLNNALSQPFSFGGSVASPSQSFVSQVNKVKQGFGPNNQVQTPTQGGSGYQYSRPQNMQYSSGPNSFSQTPGSQSRPQIGSQYRPSSQVSTKANQVQQGQFGSSSETGQTSSQGSQYQPISSKSPSQQGSSGYQYQPASTAFNTLSPSNQGDTRPKGNQYQYQPGPSNQYSNQPTSNQAQNRPDSTQTPSQTSFNRPSDQSSQNQPGLISTYSSPQGQNRFPSNQPRSGFPDSGAKGSAIQAPYDYKRPTQPLSPQRPLKPGFEKPTPSFTQGQAPVQSGFSSSIQGQSPAQSGFKQQTQGQGPSQSIFDRPIQSQGPAQPSYNQQTQSQGPSQPNFNRPIQSQGSAQPGYNQQTQGSSQPDFNRPIQSQGQAQSKYNQQTQGQGPSQPDFNRPIQSQSPAQSGFNQQTQSQGPSQSIFNRRTQGQGPAQPSYNQQSQGQGPLQPDFNRPIQSQGPARPGFNQQTKSQGPSQSIFNRPTEQQFGGPRQPPSYNPEEGYKY